MVIDISAVCESVMATVPARPARIPMPITVPRSRRAVSGFSVFMVISGFAVQIDRNDEQV